MMLIGKVEKRYEFGGDAYLVTYWQNQEHSTNFSVLRSGGWDPKTGEDAFFDDGKLLDKKVAPVFLRGHVKWDGCSNFEFPGAETCMMHGCDRNDLTQIGLLLGRIFDMCSALMEEASAGFNNSRWPVSEVVEDDRVDLGPPFGLVPKGRIREAMSMATGRLLEIP